MGGEAGSDTGRIATQIVSGIGFLGVGAIIKDGFTVRGITTAASLRIVAGIGMAMGAGRFDAALLAIVALLLLSRLYHGISRASCHHTELLSFP